MRTRFVASLALLTALIAGPVFAGGSKTSYIYKRGDRSYIRISGDISDIRKLSHKYGSEFVWVSQNGRHYVIRDAATLGAVRDAFRDVDALHPSMRAIEKKMRPYERRLHELEEQLDAFSDSLDDDDLTERTRDSIEEKMRVVERAMRDVEVEMQSVEREMERLEEESERREEKAEARFDQIIARAIANGVAERVN